MENLEHICKLLLASAYHAWCNTLHGNMSTIDKKYFEKVQNPNLNDYVFEWSSAVNCFLPEDHKNYRNPINQVGKLIYIEFMSSIIEEDSPFLDTCIDIRRKFSHPDASTIQTLDGNMFRWTNHQMIMIPCWCILK